MAMGSEDVCDLCRNDAENDLDEDGLCGDVDLCPAIPDPAQDDTDGDGIGDRCDGDVDGDGVDNDDDNCPFLENADQANTFGGRRAMFWNSSSSRGFRRWHGWLGAERAVDDGRVSSISWWSWHGGGGQPAHAYRRGQHATNRFDPVRASAPVVLGSSAGQSVILR